MVEKPKKKKKAPLSKSKKSPQAKPKMEPKKSKKRTIKRPLYSKLLMATDKFLNDLDCVQEMFQIVMPILKEQDDLRQKKIDEFLEKSEKWGKAKNNKVPIREIKELIGVIKKLNRATRMFKTNYIVTLVSRYDEYIGELIRILLQLYPDRLKKSEKNLYFEDILELKSVERIKEKFIEKEVESVLRESHSDHFKYLESQLDIPLKQNLDVWPDFIELTERRNLFTHCGGIVSDQYIRVCKRNNAELSETVCVGKSLDVDEDYANNAHKILFEIGLKLGQTISRKLFPGNYESADNALNEIGFEELCKERWDVATIVFDYATNLNQNWISSDNFRKMFLINKCIALKHSGKIQKCESSLDNVDWSSSNPKFLLAVQVLKEDYDQAENIMSSMDGKEPFTEDAFREWPIFKGFRETTQFKRAFKKIYNKPFDLTPEAKELEKMLEESKI